MLKPYVKHLSVGKGVLLAVRHAFWLNEVKNVNRSLLAHLEAPPQLDFK